MNRKQSGFTLVEIAIVLVIIGLLLGGILKGQEMITQAKIKNVISDFNGIASAQYGYQDKFGALPGNDPLAGARWPGAANGSGGGVLRGAYNSSYEMPLESNNYWQHLRLAGYVAGAGSGPQSLRQPTNAYGGMIGVQMGDGRGGVVMSSAGTADGFSGVIMCSAGVPAKIAIALDLEMDDGNGATGKVRAQRDTAPNPPIKAVLGPEDAYAQDGESTYTVCRAM